MLQAQFFLTLPQYQAATLSAVGKTFFSYFHSIIKQQNSEQYCSSLRSKGACRVWLMYLRASVRIVACCMHLRLPRPLIVACTIACIIAFTVACICLLALIVACAVDKHHCVHCCFQLRLPVRSHRCMHSVLHPCVYCGIQQRLSHRSHRCVRSRHARHFVWRAS